ncbi:branched-chain amino acid ABC transporter permease [Haloferax sp. MBLA0076]|uniref:Branched-chain amino acid ABC transporter permease n=1 Tax=Haloferax litoreum TaxID=2666140 RepID=A0A6A8GEE8_9EURY|nr:MULTISPECIES: branched-chain amino acid ABC transporter permease [Haloferax]KAB1192977.1 branched-chain amino acid ABC transporter permease [Haloferax sp. CBA1148]MRX21465.1 branched-chain amino acid ABC transporter permease [Haloferax litoreum]
MVSVDFVVTQLITGLSIGSQLFLVAVGLSLIFGVMDVLNFAHGVLYMIGAYVVVLFSTGGELLGFTFPQLGIWAGLVLAMVVVGLIGAGMEWGFIRRVYDREPLDQLLLTFAFVLIFTDIIRELFGAATSIGPPAQLAGKLLLPAGYTISTYRAFVIMMSVLTMAVLLATLRYTNVGRKVRATASDRDMAQLLGVNVPMLYTAVFFVGAALAGLGGALSAPILSIKPVLGDQVIIQSFIVVVLGGLGSFGGAFIGAYVIGIMSAMGPVIGVTGAGELMPFLAMILILLVKPEGLFGSVEA